MSKASSLEAEEYLPLTTETNDHFRMISAPSVFTRRRKHCKFALNRALRCKKIFSKTWRKIVIIFFLALTTRNPAVLTRKSYCCEAHLDINFSLTEDDSLQRSDLRYAIGFTRTEAMKIPEDVERLLSTLLELGVNEALVAKAQEIFGHKAGT
jgi:hypothetical protein